MKSLAWKWNKSRLSLHILKIKHRELVEQYRTVKNFGGQKVWRKGLLQGIGEKNFSEKACVVSMQSIRNKRRDAF